MVVEPDLFLPVVNLVDEASLGDASLGEDQSIDTVPEDQPMEERSQDTQLSALENQDLPILSSTRMTKPPIWMQDFVATAKAVQNPFSTTPPTFPYMVSPAFFFVRGVTCFYKKSI